MPMSGSFKDSGTEVIYLSDSQAKADDDLSMTEVYLLIKGFAFENILKGLVVARHPEYISSKKIDKKFTTHNLKRLAEKCGIELNEEEKEFLIAYVNEVFRYHQTKAELMALDKVMLDMAENYTLTRVDLELWEGEILLIGSENDPAFHPAEWDAMKHLYPQATVYTFQGEDHVPILTRRKEYLDVVRKFISQTNKS